MFSGFNCSLCFSEYNQTDRIPRFLVCGHSTCSKCLTDYLNSGQKQFECPIDNQSHSFSTQTLDAFPQNFSLLKIMQMEKCPDFCAVHEKKLKYVCFTDNCHICGHCVEYGDHKTHHTKSIKKIGEEATSRVKTLEAVSENLEKFSKVMSTVLETKRNSLLTFIADNVLTIKRALEKKERELISETDKFFDLTREKFNDLLGPSSLLAKDIFNKIEVYNNVLEKENWTPMKDKETLEQTFEVAQEILNQSVTQISQRASDEIERLETFVKSQLLEPLSHIRFNIANSINITDTIEKVQSFIEGGISFTTPNPGKALDLDYKDNYLTISAKLTPQETPTPTPTPTPSFSPENLHTVHLDLSESRYSNEMIIEIIQILSKVRNISQLKLNFTQFECSDQELASLLNFIFSIPLNLESLEVSLRGCQIGDSAILSFLESGIPKFTNLKKFALDLGLTQISNQSLEAFGEYTLSNLIFLEHFDLNLASTNTSDAGITQLFLRDMTTIKHFSFNLNCTKITNQSIQAFAMYCLPSMQELEHFELRLDSTAVSDDAISQLFIGETLTLKSIILDLARAHITDKSIEAFIKNGLLALENLQHLELHLPFTKVTDQSLVYLLSRNMPQLQTLIMELGNTKASDKIIFSFAQNKSISIQKLENIHFSMDNTNITEKGRQLLRQIQSEILSNSLFIENC